MRGTTRRGTAECWCQLREGVTVLSLQLPPACPSTALRDVTLTRACDARATHRPIRFD